ncbi:MAG: hypothetical protein ACI8QD_002091 [Cyclobacteriaceae bacterium]
MEPITITTQAYLILLKKDLDHAVGSSNRTLFLVTRIAYLAGIFVFWMLAITYPSSRELFGLAMLLFGIFLLTTSIKQNLKSKGQKRIRANFDRMAYQFSEVQNLTIDIDDKELKLTILKKDESTRVLFFTFSQLSSYQWLSRAYLISNPEGIDFILPEGLCEPNIHSELREKIEKGLKFKDK